MYKLEFRANKSRYFLEAYNFALELGGALENGVVKIEIKDVLSAYAQVRTLFGIIQNWKGTLASYNGSPVHPYQFLLDAHRTRQCSEAREFDKDCGGGWSCLRIDNLVYNIDGRAFKKNKYWYNFGAYKGYRWEINKAAIYKTLLSYAKKKALDSCPFFDEVKLEAAVRNLPDFLIPDNLTFKIVYKEQYIQGQLLEVPDNIVHLERVQRAPLIG